MFGLPLSTTIVAFGIPVILIAVLIWWGFWFRPDEMENTGDTEDPDS